MRNILIVGGGFAGMWAALTAAREIDGRADDIKITLVSRDAFLTVRPRLYECFSEGLRAPLQPSIGPVDVELVLGDVRTIDTARQLVAVAANGGSETELPYDRLILAAGSEQRTLPVPGAAEFGLDIDTFAGAEAFDRHLQTVLRGPERPGKLTFTVIGGGFTGVELATEMRNRIERHADPATARSARVVLIERAGVVGPELGENPRPIIETALRDAGVSTHLNANVAVIDADGVTLADGERIDSATVVITAGLTANPLTRQLNTELDPQGRVFVDESLRVEGVAGVFAAGDAACAKTDPDHVALMSCQHAIPMGKHAGYNAAHDLLGSPLRSYSQPNYVTCLDLGVAGAVFTTGWERKPEMSGDEAKQLKQMINTQWIYPPTGARADIIAAADLDAPWPPAV